MDPHNPKQSNDEELINANAKTKKRKEAEEDTATAGINNFEAATDVVSSVAKKKSKVGNRTDDNKNNIVNKEEQDDTTPAITEDEVLQKRHARLESNRKAAKESRRRKKVLVEELQHSVVFFTRANVQLRQEKERLESTLFSARGKLLTLQAAAATSLPPSTMKTASLPTVLPTSLGGVLTASAAAAASSQVSPPLPRIVLQQPQLPTVPLPVVTNALLLQQQQQQAAAQAQLLQSQQQSMPMQQLQSWLAMAQAAAQQVFSLATSTSPGSSVGINVPTLLGGIPINDNNISGLNVPAAGGMGGLLLPGVMVPPNPMMTVGLPNLLGLGGVTTTTTNIPLSLGLENNNSTNNNDSGTTTTSVPSSWDPNRYNNNSSNIS